MSGRGVLSVSHCRDDPVTSWTCVPSQSLPLLCGCDDQWIKYAGSRRVIIELDGVVGPTIDHRPRRYRSEYRTSRDGVSSTDDHSFDLASISHSNLNQSLIHITLTSSCNARTADPEIVIRAVHCWNSYTGFLFVDGSSTSWPYWHSRSVVHQPQCTSPVTSDRVKLHVVFVSSTRLYCTNLLPELSLLTVLSVALLLQSGVHLAMSLSLALHLLYLRLPLRHSYSVRHIGLVIS